MRIKILAVDISHVKEGKKDYKLMDVSFKNLDFGGKVEGKKLVSFASPDVFNALKDAQPGAEFDVTKGDKTAAGHVPWVRCVPATGENVGEGTGSTETVHAPKVVTNGTGTPRSTYETADERAKKQVYIVRQSSLANAIAFVGTGVQEFAVKDIINIAKQFEKYVFSTDPVKALMEMDDDIPL